MVLESGFMFLTGIFATVTFIIYIHPNFFIFRYCSAGIYAERYPFSPITVNDGHKRFVVCNFFVNVKKCIISIQMAALDIWSGIDDFDVAKDRYLKFCALGDHIPFKEALSEVGIHNVFEEKCSIILAEQITEEFGFDYEDVKHDEWYYNAVFFSLPYVDGLSDVEYGINQNASRGIIATGIAGLCRGENVESKAKFTDIPANNKVYINWAYDNGIIYGYDDTLFGYSDDVTREQAVVMLYRCAEFLGTDNSEASSQIIYTDADAVSDWAVEAVSWASSIGIIRGYEDGTFKPFNSVTKAEFAQMLYAFADVVH